MIHNSDIRQIPDTQEVYLDKEGYTSILFDILERVADPPSDLGALEFHLSDIVDGDTGDVRIIEAGQQTVLARLP